MAFSLNLDTIRAEDQARSQKTPFQHQIDAFDALSRTFTFADGSGKGGLLVLPTGAGKTFTTVK